MPTSLQGASISQLSYAVVMMFDEKVQGTMRNTYKANIRKNKYLPLFGAAVFAESLLFFELTRAFYIRKCERLLWRITTLNSGNSCGTL